MRYGPTLGKRAALSDIRGGAVVEGSQKDGPLDNVDVVKHCDIACAAEACPLEDDIPPVSSNPIQSTVSIHVSWSFNTIS